MKNLLIIFLLVAFVGCHKNNPEDLLGEWKEIEEIEGSPGCYRYCIFTPGIYHMSMIYENNKIQRPDQFKIDINETQFEIYAWYDEIKDVWVDGKRSKYDIFKYKITHKGENVFLDFGGNTYKKINR